ncbi:glutamate--cysteine ligase [Cellulomonas fimi]|nr:glutamate--cysteine ligase [Cellulomonas fimi]
MSLTTARPPQAARAAASVVPEEPRILRSVGVEEELLLVDPGTGRTVAASVAVTGGPPDEVAVSVPAGISAAASSALTSAAVDASVTAASDDAVGPRVVLPLTTELQQEQVETATPPRTRMADLAADLRALRRCADDAARTVGARVAALATYPLTVTPVLTPSPRYRAIRDQMGLTCAEQLTCGCHVHVAVESDDEGVAVLDRLRPWLPLLTAVAANSPYWQGADTGYAGYRTQAWNRWPGTGPADPFGSAAAYHAVVAELLATGTVLDEGMVYFDARLSRHYPTVEVRVADVCLDVDDAVLVAALTRGLVETCVDRWRAGEPAPGDPTSVLRMAAWRASRSGTTGDLVHPRTHRLVPAAEALACLLEHVGPALGASGDLGLVEQGIERVLARGTGAARQREVAAASGRLEGVVKDAAERTVA